jgi:hypothetical protein
MSESAVSLKRHRLAQLGPLTIISVGIILSFAWTAFLAWLMVCVLSEFL